MPVVKAYLAEPQALTGNATVLALLEGEKPAVRLDKTWFHPQGGGQKGDKGMIGNIVVTDTKHAEGGEVDHFVASLEGLKVGQNYSVVIDASSRHINAANHSAGHLIAAIVDAAFPEIKAVQGHHWPGEARVEFEGAVTEELAGRVAAYLQAAADKAIAEKWPVTLKGDPFASRAIHIGTVEPVPCGGTHVAHMGQIKNIAIKSVKKKGDRLRVSYTAEANDAEF